MPEEDCPARNDHAPGVARATQGEPVRGVEDVIAYVPAIPDDAHGSPWPTGEGARVELLSGIPDPGTSMTRAPETVPARETTPRESLKIHNAILEAAAQTTVEYLPRLGAPWSSEGIIPDLLQAEEGEPTVRKGDEGDWVKKLQEILNKLGYRDEGGESLKEDGKFGKKTEDAVKDFQEDNDADVDGVVGPETWKKLKDALEALANGDGEAQKDADKPAKPGDIEKVRTLNEMLEKLKSKMTKEQEQKYAELEKQKIDKLLKELEDTLKKWGQSTEDDAGDGASIFTAEDKARWNTEENARWLARVIMSEASIGNEAEQTAVGYVVLNRMKRNGKDKVEDVVKPNKFAYNQDPEDPDTARLDIVKLAKGILSCSVADNSGGATHFYSPQSMPKEGENTEGYDVGGGLESTDGLDKRNYKPSWAADGEYPRVPVEEAVDKRFKFHKQPGSGKVH